MIEKFYSTLDLEELDLTAEEIKLIGPEKLLYFQEKLKDKPSAIAEMEFKKYAYSILSDKEKKEEYDTMISYHRAGTNKELVDTWEKEMLSAIMSATTKAIFQ